MNRQEILDNVHHLNFSIKRLNQALFVLDKAKFEPVTNDKLQGFDPRTLFINQRSQYYNEKQALLDALKEEI